MLRRLNRILPSVAAMALATAATLAQAAEPQGPPPAPVAVKEATTERLAEVMRVPGTVVSRNDARISAEVSGRLSWVADIGDLVEADEVLARVDDSLLRLQLADTDANVKRLEATATYQNSQVDRLRRLAADNVAARDQLEQAESQLVIAEQQLAQARVAREQAAFRLERTEVRAPFSGRVVERVKQPGEYITVGGDLLRLVDTRNLEVRAQAPLEVSAYVAQGMPVEVSDRQGFVSDRDNLIRTVIPVGDERSRMMEIRITLADPRWAPGSAVRVALPRSAPRSVLAVHRDALVLRQDAIYVYRVNDDGVAERIPVQPGSGHGEMIEVQGEIQPGDRIITRGAERLQPGQAVAITGGGV